MKFTKMEGLGNDYVYVYGAPKDPEKLSVKLSDRHFGIGGDGLVLISLSDVADFKMRIFNADGSEAKMCGNGVRCVGKYVYDKGYTKKTEISVETLSGIKYLKMSVRDGKVDTVSVDMGKVVLGEEESLDVVGGVKLIPVDVGNPHAVIFVDDADKAPVDTVGPLIEKNPRFPGGVNVEFVSVTGKNKLRMRVWERGSGITMACGTGTCASVAAAIAKGYCDEAADVDVTLDGGVLTIRKDGDRVTMTGPARTVFEGEIEC